MTRLRAWLPLLLTLFGAVLFGGLWVRRILALGPTQAGLLGSGACLVYGLWLVWESRVSARERVRLEVDHDHGTLELAAGAKYALLAACLLPAADPGLPVGGLGFALLALGAHWRVVAIVHLGTAYSHRIRPPRLPLVTGGPYAVVRHPAYLGTLLAHGGLTLVFGSPWSIAALLLLWVPAVLVRVVLEDRFLRSIPEYAEYATQVPSKLIPRLI